MSTPPHVHAAQPVHDTVAGWVRGRAVPAAEVEDVLARLRSGPRAAVLPVAESPEGRQLRRWVAQTVFVERLLEDEHHRARTAGGEPAPAPSHREVVPDLGAAVALGGVVAAVMRRSAAARAVWAAVTGHVSVPDEDAVAYVERNPGSTRSGATEALLQARRRERFLDWLAREQAAGVRLGSGYEHPGDPRQPDATHRH